MFTRALIITLCLLMLASPASAESFDDDWQPDDLRAYSPHYQGMFTEVGARYGLANVSSFGQGDSFGAHARFAFPMGLGDLRLAYGLDRLTPSTITPQLTTTLQRHTLNLALGVHPFYLMMLGSGWFNYVIGGIYADVGAGPQFITSSARNDPGLHWHYGAGVDIPLLDPDRRGHAPWLNLAYRRVRGDIDLPQSSVDLHTHIFSIGLAWRINRLPF